MAAIPMIIGGVVLIQMDGQVETQAMELFRAGVGNKSLDELKEMGVDKHDLELFKKHWNELVR